MVVTELHSECNLKQIVSFTLNATLNKLYLLPWNPVELSNKRIPKENVSAEERRKKLTASAVMKVARKGQKRERLLGWCSHGSSPKSSHSSRSGIAGENQSGRLGVAGMEELGRGSKWEREVGREASRPWLAQVKVGEGYLSLSLRLLSSVFCLLLLLLSSVFFLNLLDGHGLSTQSHKNDAMPIWMDIGTFLL